MKKSDKIILGIYIVMGIAMIIIGVVMNVDYYSSIIFGMGVGLSTNSCVQVLRYYHNTRPENMEAYQKKLKEQQIELMDERKVQLRNRAGYLAWAITMLGCFAVAFVAAMFRAETRVICLLSGLAIVEFIAATVIYKNRFQMRFLGLSRY